MNKSRRGPDNTLRPQPNSPLPQPVLSPKYGEEAGEGRKDSPAEEMKE